MPKSSEYFKDSDKIPLENIIKWLDPIPSITALENYLGNKSLYPESVPLTEADMRIDLAVLKSRVSSGKGFINPKLKKVYIPEELTEIIPDLTKLAAIFIDALDFSISQIWTLVLIGQKEEEIGTILKPQFRSNSGAVKINFLKKSYVISQGSVIVIPCVRCSINFNITEGTILNTNEGSLEITGGKLGLLIDGRKK